MLGVTNHKRLLPTLRSSLLSLIQPEWYKVSSSLSFRIVSYHYNIYLFSLPIPWKFRVIGYGFRWEDVQYKKAGRDKLKEARLRVIEGRLKDREEREYFENRIW